MQPTAPGTPAKIVVTGASGFIGRHMTLALSRHCRLFCLARRSQTEADIPCSAQIHWIQGDIAEPEQVQRIAQYIQSLGGADCVLHLAGYYDFSQQENPGYEATNVIGTRNILELAQNVQASHFIFSSSLAACEFTPPGHVIDESTPVSAQFPYARSKRRAEEIIREQRKDMQSSIIRLAAVYSDWCEFPPVYSLLETWLSGSLLSRALGGKGQFAIPYIHVNDVIAAVMKIMSKAPELPSFGVYNVSPNGATSHTALFRAATKYYFGRERKALHVPKTLAWGALHIQSLLFRLLHNKEPFERPWMAKYIDKQLNIQADHTYQQLGWRPTPRYHILRRLLFLAENKRAHPQNWLFRNESMITQRTPERRSLLIHRSLQESREKVVSEIMNSLVATEQKQKFPNLSQAPRDSIHWFTDFIFQVLSFSIKTRDRYILSEATQIMTSYCYNQGYKQYELKHFMYIYQKTLKNNLLTQPNLAQHADRIHDFIDLNLQFIIDEIEDNYEALAEHKSSEIAAVTSPPQTDFKEIFRFAQRIESICGDPVIEPPQIQTPAPGKDSQGQIHGD